MYNSLENFYTKSQNRIIDLFCFSILLEIHIFFANALGRLCLGASLLDTAIVYGILIILLFRALPDLLRAIDARCVLMCLLLLLFITGSIFFNLHLSSSKYQDAIKLAYQSVPFGLLIASAISDFKLLDRKVVDVLLSLPERNTFFRALSFWAGFRTESVQYEVQERQFGESKWSFWSLMKYAVSNATSFSTLPLQLVTVMGVVSILFSLILAIQTLVRFLMGNSVEGFTTVILLILIIGGFLMLSLGIIGHYIARIYEEVKGRPKYIISKVTDNVQGEIIGSWRKKQ